MLLVSATGTCVLVASPHYAGLGNVAASTRTEPMLAKHVLVAAFVALAVTCDLLVRRVERAPSPQARTSALDWLARSAEGAARIGALIVLLTAVAQATP